MIDFCRRKCYYAEQLCQNSFLLFFGRLQPDELDDFVSLFFSSNKQLLLKNSHLSMIAQKRELDKVMYEWMGKEKQMDDMLVVGIRI